MPCSMPCRSISSIALAYGGHPALALDDKATGWSRRLKRQFGARLGWLRIGPIWFLERATVLLVQTKIRRSRF